MDDIEKEYSFYAMWDKDQKEYVGLCREFPYCSGSGDTVNKAIDEIIDIVKEIVVK